MDIDRWNKVFAGATQRISKDLVCKNEQEIKWYDQIVREMEWARKNDIALTPVSEYEG